MALLSYFQSPNSVLKIVQDSRKRKENAETRLRFYHDKQIDDLYDQIKKRWSSPDDFRLFFINVVRKVTDRRAMVYAGTPYRTFEGMRQEDGETLYRAMNANIVMKKANRLTKLCKTTALKVGWHNDHPMLDVVTPNVLDAVHDGYPEEPIELIVTKPGIREQDTTYADWTATTYRLFDYRGQPMTISGNANGVNPYGILPFVPVFDRNPDDEFFLSGGDDLIEAQRAVNVALANLWRAIELQSHGQAWASGLPAGDVVRAGPDRTIALPADGKFDFAAPNTPIEGVLKAIEFMVKQTAVANDLAANVFEIDPAAESGAAKLVENLDLMEARADDIELWRQYEGLLFEVVKRVANTHKPNSIPEQATINIDFGELSQGTDENTLLDTYKKRIDLGIWSPVDALMADNPDIRTREDAMIILKDRAAEAAELSPYGDPSEEEMLVSLGQSGQDTVQ
jgi:hypothetical protein